MYSKSKTLQLVVGAVLGASLVACGGGGGGSSSPMAVTPQSLSVPVMVSDASSEDWATIGVKVLSIAVIPQGGGAATTVYTSSGQMVNLEELDQISELLGNAMIPVGTSTYSAAAVAPGQTICFVSGPRGGLLISNRNESTSLGVPSSGP